MLHHLDAHRPLLSFDRDEIRRRTARAFALGHQDRCLTTAAELERLAREIRDGRHGELLLTRAAELIRLRHRRGA